MSQSVSLKQIKSRIKGIENTRKLVYAIEMVSRSKFKNTERLLKAAERYSLKLEALVNNLSASPSLINHPFLQEKGPKARITLCLITSDTGLCGAYNHNIIRLAEDFIRRSGKDGLSLLAIGRKGFNYFRKKGLLAKDVYIDIFGRYSNQIQQAVLKKLADSFIKGETDEIYFAYTRFYSYAKRAPLIEKFLPLKAKQAEAIDYIFEPDINGVVEDLLPEYLSVKVREVILQAFASEHSARIIAMSEATENAVELLDGLVLLRNKIRQASITREIMEIISSAEALKG